MNVPPIPIARAPDPTGLNVEGIEMLSIALAENVTDKSILSDKKVRFIKYPFKIIFQMKIKQFTIPNKYNLGN
jgi:hypothetical protein